MLSLVRKGIIILLIKNYLLNNSLKGNPLVPLLCLNCCDVNNVWVNNIDMYMLPTDVI